MDNFITTVNAVLPLFLIMALGYGIRRTPLMDEHTHQKMNKLIFQLFLPILLFKNISTSSLDALSGSWVFVFGFVSEMALFLILFAVVPLIEKENRRRGVLIQALGRSNYALFGLPLVGLLYPGEDIAVASMLVAISIPVFNVMSVVALETWRGGKLNVLKILRGIVTNPLIIGCALGFVWLVTGIQLPQFLQTAIDDTSSIATPLSLFVLGGAFEFSRVRCNMRPLLIGTIGRLIVVPVVGITATVLMGFRGMELYAMCVAFMAPLRGVQLPHGSADGRRRRTRRAAGRVHHGVFDVHRVRLHVRAQELGIHLSRSAHIMTRSAPTCGAMRPGRAVYSARPFRSPDYSSA